MRFRSANREQTPYSNTTGSPSAKSAKVMSTLTKRIERKKQRPAHPKADGAQTRKSLVLADRAQFRPAACLSW